jgi:hypothetical protein
VLKDPGILLDVHRAAPPDAAHPWANPPVEIDATPEALERAVAGAAG